MPHSSLRLSLSIAVLLCACAPVRTPCDDCDSDSVSRRDAGSPDAGSPHASTPDGPARLELSPLTFDFGDTCVGASRKVELRLTNPGEDALAISDVAISGEPFTILAAPPTTLPPGMSASALVAFSPAFDIDFVGTFSLSTSSPETPAMSVVLTGSGVEGEPRVLEWTCQPDGTGDVQTCHFLTFDEVPVGSAVERVVTVANRGCGSLRVTNAYLAVEEGGEPSDVGLFELDGPSSFVLDVAPRELRVRFRPTAAGQLPAVRLNLATDDPNHPSVSIGLFASSAAD